MAIPKMDGVENDALKQYVNSLRTGRRSSSGGKSKATVKTKRASGNGYQRTSPVAEPDLEEEMEKELERWLLNIAMGSAQQGTTYQEPPVSTSAWQGQAYQDPPPNSTVYGQASAGNDSQSPWWMLVEDELSGGNGYVPDDTLPAIDGDPNLFPLYLEIYQGPQREGISEVNVLPDDGDGEYKTQYDYDIYQEFGNNSCGYFAVTRGDSEEMEGIHDNYGDSTYTSEYGIQPGELYNEVSAYYSLQGGSATQSQYNTISDLADAIETGGTVVVDIRVGDDTIPNPTEGSDFAHFAEVLAVDFDSETVVLANSLTNPGPVEIPFDEFYEIWFDPENLSDYGMDHDEYEKEVVVNWMMVVDKGEKGEN